MSGLEILVLVLGVLTAAVLILLGWAFLAIAKLHDEVDDQPCCYRPDIVKREWQGRVGDWCSNCGLWQRPPEPATKSSPGTMDRGDLERPTEGRSDAA